MIEKLKYLFQTAGHNLWQFRSRNIFSLVIICLAFLTVGIFLSLSNNLRLTARNLANNMLIAFFLDKNADETSVKALMADIAAVPFIKEVRFVGEAEALEKFKAGFPELKGVVENLKSNPFPPSIEARVSERTPPADRLLRFIENIRGRPFVTDIQYNQDWIERVKAFNRIVNSVGVFLGGILLLASVFIISNVIRLNVFARKNEIEILRLVGSTNLFIRIPFWLEGVVLGLLGSLLSLSLLLVVIRTLPLYIGPSLGALGELLSFSYPDRSQVALILAGGTLTGFFGSATAVSRFLKI